MNIDVVPFKADHAYDILERNIKDGIKVTIPENLNDVISNWAGGGPSYTLIVNNEIIASAGVLIIGPHHGEAWSLMTRSIRKYPKTLLKVCRSKLDEIVRDNKLIRIQSTVFEGVKSGCRFVECLGFKNETPNGMIHFGENGETVYLFARV